MEYNMPIKCVKNVISHSKLWNNKENTKMSYIIYI